MAVMQLNLVDQYPDAKSDGLGFQTEMALEIALAQLLWASSTPITKGIF